MEKIIDDNISRLESSISILKGSSHVLVTGEYEYIRGLIYGLYFADRIDEETWETYKTKVNTIYNDYKERYIRC